MMVKKFTLFLFLRHQSYQIIDWSTDVHIDFRAAEQTRLYLDLDEICKEPVQWNHFRPKLYRLHRLTTLSSRGGAGRAAGRRAGVGVRPKMERSCYFTRSYYPILHKTHFHIIPHRSGDRLWPAESFRRSSIEPDETLSLISCIKEQLSSSTGDCKN